MIIFLNAVSLKKLYKLTEGKHKETELSNAKQNTKNGAEIYHMKFSKGKKEN